MRQLDRRLHPELLRHTFLSCCGLVAFAIDGKVVADITVESSGLSVSQGVDGVAIDYLPSFPSVDLALTLPITPGRPFLYSQTINASGGTRYPSGAGRDSLTATAFNQGSSFSVSFEGTARANTTSSYGAVTATDDSSIVFDTVVPTRYTATYSFSGDSYSTNFANISGETMPGISTYINDTPGKYTGVLLPQSGASITTSEGASGTSGTSFALSVALQELPPLDFFGVGVNWSTNPFPTLSAVRGDLGATDLNTAMATLPTYLHGEVVSGLDPTGSGAQNIHAVTRAFNGFQSQVGEHDTVVFYVSSHGGFDANHNPIISTSALPFPDSGGDLTPNTIAGYLNELPAGTNKIVILDSCHAGAFGPPLSAIPNTAILTAVGAGEEAAVDPKNGIGLFTEELSSLIRAGEITNLNELAATAGAQGTESFGSLLGQSLPLEDSGFGQFQGFEPGYFQNDSFSADLLGPVLVPEPTGNTQSAIGGIVAVFFLMRRRRRHRRS